MNKNSQVVWARWLGPLTCGRVDATDAGWTTNGRIRRLVFEARRYYVLVIVGKRSYIIAWKVV